jgi:hypothetical protein
MIDLPSEADGAGPRDEQPGPRDLWGEHSVARRSLGARATAAVPVSRSANTDGTAMVRTNREQPASNPTR